LQTGDVGSRGAIWKAGMKVFVRHELVGVGAGGFSSAVEQELGRPFAAHNAFIAVAVEQGLIGLMLFVALFVTALRPRDRFAKTDGRFRFVLFATLIIGLMPLNWDYAKPMWFVLTMLAAQTGLRQPADSGHVELETIVASRDRRRMRRRNPKRIDQLPVAPGGGAL
jgi:O-antigen ligase